MFAFVCLDTRQIGYISEPQVPSTLSFRVDRLKGQYYDEKGLIDFHKARELNKSIKNKSEIARTMNLDIATVHRYLTDGFAPFETNARYFSHIERQKDWFYGI